MYYFNGPEDEQDKRQPEGYDGEHDDDSDDNDDSDDDWKDPGDEDIEWDGKYSCCPTYPSSSNDDPTDLSETPSVWSTDDSANDAAQESYDDEDFADSDNGSVTSEEV